MVGLNDTAFSDTKPINQDSKYFMILTVQSMLDLYLYCLAGALLSIHYRLCLQ